MFRFLLMALLLIASQAFAAYENRTYMVVVNETGRTIIGIYLVEDPVAEHGGTPDFTGVPGKNLLAVTLPGAEPNTQPPVLKPGESRGILYDWNGDMSRLRIVYDNYAVEERRRPPGDEIVLRPGWALADDPDRPSNTPSDNAPPIALRLINGHQRTIESVHIYPDHASPGEDRLGRRSLAPGETFDLSLARPSPQDRAGCWFTISVRYLSWYDVAVPRGPETRTGINLCTIRTVTFEHGWTTTDTLRAPGVIRNNSADGALSRLHIDLPGAPRGEAREYDILWPGDAMAVTPPVAGQCRYRVTGILRNNDDEEREVSVDADLCSRMETVLE